MPIAPDMCCVCSKPIAPGERAQDADGAWDVHTGRCAALAGIVETAKGPQPE